MQQGHLVRPATVTVQVVDVTFVRTLRYGYVRGMDESILAALSRFDMPISELTDADLQFGDLSTLRGDRGRPERLQRPAGAFAATPTGCSPTPARAAR